LYLVMRLPLIVFKSFIPVIAGRNAGAAAHHCRGFLLGKIFSRAFHEPNTSRRRARP
jgi:hypothetical protein